ncbi:unnamed protein product [Heterobilharzia americana]|nr:unnamed protein product [Heterobilharzia americana]
MIRTHSLLLGCKPDLCDSICFYLAAQSEVEFKGLPMFEIRKRLNWSASLTEEVKDGKHSQFSSSSDDFSTLKRSQHSTWKEKDVLRRETAIEIKRTDFTYDDRLHT